MKEITFLKQNYQKWQQFEDLLNSNQGQNPDALADLFIRITDDLSWAHTFYPGSNTEKYLNDLAARIHQEIYKNKKEKRSRLISFWTQEIPRTMAKNRLNLLIVFLIFAVSVWIGAISAQHDPNFVRIILGDNYVDRTLENMSNNDPLGIYKNDNQFVMFFEIALNNSSVALVCIVVGIFGWMGVAYMQFANGVMLGAFLYFLADHGYYHEAMLTVWIHGVIEIFCILVAGAAGMALGNGLFFPGAWPRGVSFMRGAREALKIGIGLIPFFFFAAFFEGFVTRFTAMNDIGRIAIIFTTFFFVIWYFVYWPFVVTSDPGKGLSGLSEKADDENVASKNGFLSRMGSGVVYLIGVAIVLMLIPVVMLIVNLNSNTTADMDKFPVIIFCEGGAIVCFILAFLGFRLRAGGVRINARFGFMLAIGFLLIFLPTIALVMQIVTKTRADIFSYFFFTLCLLAGIACIVFGFLGRKNVTEDNLIIDRKVSAKADEYERNATATKI